MPPADSHLHRRQSTNNLNAALDEGLSPRSVGAIVGCSAGALLLLIMGLYIWYDRRLKRKQRAQRIANNGVLDVVTLQKQNQERLQALRSLLPAKPATDRRSRAPSSHPIWKEYRHRFEAQLRAEGYSETAIQLASESGYEDTIFPDDSATQMAEGGRVPFARMREYVSQQIQEEITRQRGLGYIGPSSETATVGSRTELSQRAPSVIPQAARSRFSRWFIRRGNGEDLPALPPPTSLSRARPNRSGQSISRTHLSNLSSVPAERVLRPEAYTANDRIRYMVRVASEEQWRMQ